MQLKKSILFLILIIALSLQSVIYVFTHSSQFFSRDYTEKYADYKNAYYSSQYVVKENPIIIPDYTLEAFAGGAFLYGLNPILITHDHPPLGRYITSLSIFLFDNANTLMLFCLLFTGVGIFLITYQLSQNKFLSLVPVAIFCNEPIFIDKLVNTPLLEPIQLPFIVFTFYFFIKALYSRNFIPWFVCASVMLGFAISTRFFIVGLVMLASMMCYLLLHEQMKRLTVVFILTLPLSILVLLLSYTRTILDGYTPLQIIGIQHYILNYHNSKFILPFSFWDLILFNRWHTWWGGNFIIQDKNWLILWPVFTVLFTVSLFLRVSSYIKFPKALDLLMIWVVGYMAMLSLGYTSTRYFLPLLPFMYIVVTVVVGRLLKIVKTR